jgi:hypothetical protein
MEEKLSALFQSRVNIELFFTFDTAGDAVYGVRVRPWANSPKSHLMVLAAGPTVEDALVHAYDKAAAGRWEKLDWAARPWGSASGAEGTLDV